MKRKVTKAIFPVAGLGTRFLPATKSIPKEIMTLVDRPLIQYAIDEARDGGKVYGYSFQGERYDCGSKAGYLKTDLAEFSKQTAAGL